MNEVREGAAHKLKPIVSGITLSPSTSEIRSRTRYTEIIFYIGLRKIGNWVTGSNTASHAPFPGANTLCLLFLDDSMKLFYELAPNGFILLTLCPINFRNLGYEWHVRHVLSDVEITFLQ